MQVVEQIFPGSISTAHTHPSPTGFQLILTGLSFSRLLPEPDGGSIRYSDLIRNCNDAYAKSAFISTWTEGPCYIATLSERSRGVQNTGGEFDQQQTSVVA